MRTLTSQNHTPGFANPVHDAQQVFRAVLEALARPGTRHSIEANLNPPEPLGASTGAVILTLCDEQTPIWLDPTLRASSAVGGWIAFHTGARIVENAGEALFVIASSPKAAPTLADLMQGTDEEPHRSATLIIDAQGSRSIGNLVASGPGISGTIGWDGVGLPIGFLPQWRENGMLFPCGVDIVLAAETTVQGLPRTTALVSADQQSHQQRSA
ncbi:phosphonate C-P lyase system protein PhnH [Arthrobacter glacialis]|uniref:Phosphonate C-P lyase system protein PhnH n=1 Tax=Arthrobacter glacialis TaxID=1664 RepID=A0A2S3ZV63_ARTGL|nr:phosphonate C-P lyase system protein PhnH [Arthrobacter glacialis]POH73136.1 phosphonate C-P lyase system protein PhnH [Arthrobacter glacialis]